MDLGLVILRIVVGVLMIGHGTQKLFGWFGGPGHKTASGYVTSRGFSPGGFWTAAGSTGEAAGGLLLALGFLSPLGAVGVGASMVTAIAAFHWPKFWATEGGYEYPLVLLAAAVALGIAGPGAYSLDAAFGISLPATVTWAIVVLAALGVLTGLVGAARTRRRLEGASRKSAA